MWTDNEGRDWIDYDICKPTKKWAYKIHVTDELSSEHIKSYIMVSEFDPVTSTFSDIIYPKVVMRWIDNSDIGGMI